MNKKAQSLSMNVIIIAALALLVLVILAVMFINKSLWFQKGTDACETLGGTCIPGTDADACTSRGMQYNAIASCQSNRQVCCIDIGLGQ